MKIIYLLIVIMLLASCAPATEVATQVSTPAPSFTSTASLILTSTKSPTSTPAIPTATITPMIVEAVSASPLALTELNAGTEMKRLNVIGTGTPHDLKFSPDGTRLAVATGRGVYLYDGTTFEQNGFIDVNDSVSAIAFSPDGNFLALAINGKASLWNVQSGQNILNLDGGMVGIGTLAYGRGDYVAALGGECKGCGTPVLGMILWNANTGHQIYAEHEIWYDTTALVFTKDGSHLIFGGKRGITTIESETGKLVDVYKGSEDAGTPFNLVMSNNETRFVVSTFFSNNLTINIDTTNRQETSLSICGVHIVQAANMVVCSKEKSIVLVNGITGEKIKSFDIDVDADTLWNMMVVSPDGKFIVYEGKPGFNIIETTTGIQLKSLSFTDFQSALLGIAQIDKVERYFAAVIGSEGNVEIFDLQTGELLRTLKSDCCEIDAFNIVPDQKSIVTLSGSVLNIWDISDQRVIYKEDLGDKYFGPVGFAPDGSKIYVFDNEPAIREFNLQTKEMKILGGSYVRNTEYHFNTLGHLILLSYEKDDKGFSSPVFTDTVTNQEIILPYHAIADASFLEAFALSPDSKTISFGSGNGIFVWDARTQKQLWHFDKHEQQTGDGWIGAIAGLEFSPQSNNLLVSVGWDGTTRLWSISTGNQLRVLNVCCDAHFTPDGRYLVTTGDGVMRVWGIQQ